MFYFHDSHKYMTMATLHSIEPLLSDKSLTPELRQIAEKVANAERITETEGLLLYEQGELGYLGTLANVVRERKHGDNTYFNRNFHIEPTNICIYTCAFCSYSRLIKQRTDGWEYTMEEIMDIVRKYDHEPVTEVHIVGGVLPQYDVAFYAELFRQIKAHRPELHVKALTPVEYHYIFKKAKISYEEGLRIMKEAGLDSMPGGGAEIFHPEIREKIAGDKCTGQQWLRHTRSMAPTGLFQCDHAVRPHRGIPAPSGPFGTIAPIAGQNRWFPNLYSAQIPQPGQPNEPYRRKHGGGRPAQLRHQPDLFGQFRPPQSLLAHDQPQCGSVVAFFRGRRH